MGARSCGFRGGRAPDAKSPEQENINAMTIHRVPLLALAVHMLISGLISRVNAIFGSRLFSMGYIKIGL